MKQVPSSGCHSDLDLFFVNEWKWTLSFLEVGQFVIKLTIKSVVDVNLFHFKAFLPVQ